MKKIYLSIPISGVENSIIERVQKALQDLKSIIEKEKKNLGKEWENYEVIFPVDFNVDAKTVEEFFAGSGNGNDYAWFMGRDIENLLRCDAMFLADGWEDSKGCQAEKACGLIYDIRVLQNIK